MNSEQLSDLVVAVLDDNKAQEIVKLDVRKLTSVTDYMIVASGTSNRHVRALIEHVTEKTKEAGRTPIGVEGEDGGEWVLLDLDDALVHVMLPKVRDFYNLEKLWSLGPVSSVAAGRRHAVRSANDETQVAAIQLPVGKTHRECLALQMRAFFIE